MTQTSYDSAVSLRELDCKIGGNAPRALPVALRHSDQRGVVRVVWERRCVRLELLEQLAEAIVDHVRVDDLLEGGQLGCARRGPAGRHEHLHVPQEHPFHTAKVRELAQARLQLREGRIHRPETLPACGSTAEAGATLAAVADESPELFDDIYLGLRAGGAVRKQRRGEPLSVEEKEAIGRWQRLSLWRKFIAIGAFALGTFGLGFTVGGLVFGRWRKA